MFLISLTPQKSRQEWQVAFFIMAAVHVVGGVNYLFTTTTVQPWANQSAHVGRDVTENGVTGSDVIEAKCNLVVGCEGREERGEGRKEESSPG